MNVNVVKNLNELLGTMYGFCEICDNHTPRVYVEDFGQECCEICYEAYGECN